MVMFNSYVKLPEGKLVLLEAMGYHGDILGKSTDCFFREEQNKGSLSQGEDPQVVMVSL